MKFIVTEVLSIEPVREKENYKIWGWIVNAKVDDIHKTGLKLGYAGKNGIDLVVNKEYTVSYNEEYKNYKLIINKSGGAAGYTPKTQYNSFYTIEEYDELWKHAYGFLTGIAGVASDGTVLIDGFRELLSTYIISATNKGIKVKTTVSAVNTPEASVDHSHEFYEPIIPETRVAILSAIKDHISKHPGLSDDWQTDWAKCGGLDKVSLETMKTFYKLYVLEQ
jgi:hypothetical protein